MEHGCTFHSGRGALATPQSASALAGLTLLRHLAELTSAGDKPPIATSGEAALAILSQDTLQMGSLASAQGAYDPTAGRLTGLTPFSYAAGAIPTIRDENISTNILIGNFGVEAALLADAAERANTFTLASSDNLTAQAVLYASAQEALIGEELFAAGAYVNARPIHYASLTAQDILRWLIIGVILVGAVLKIGRHIVKFKGYHLDCNRHLLWCTCPGGIYLRVQRRRFALHVGAIPIDNPEYSRHPGRVCGIGGDF